MAESDDSSDLVRGILIALALLGVAIVAFLVASHGGRARTPEIFSQIETLFEPAEKPRPAPRIRKEAPATRTPDPATVPQASPAASAGAADSNTLADGAAADAGGGAGGGMGAPAPAPSPARAGQALRDAILHYRADPRHTASVTISSAGRIVQGTEGPLTVHDGLPMGAVRGSIVLSGASPQGSGAP